MINLTIFFQSETSVDNLKVYQGTVGSLTLLATYNGAVGAVNYSPSYSGLYVSFHWKTDGSVIKSNMVAYVDY